MTVEHQEEGSKGSFAISENDKFIAAMTYSKAGEDKMIIDHTEVSEDFKGQGLGKKMLLALVDYVREHNIKVIPLCPYAKSVFDKDSSLKDVLA